MKRLVLLAVSFFVIIDLFAQSQGISYQAVIIDQNPLEVPGKDISGNILPNHPLLVRFTILDAAGTIEFKEEHTTTTDEYGMINLMIGRGTPAVTSPRIFTEIDWDGSPKALKVDISFSDTDVFFTDFSYEELTFVPYAYHKNITATGSLIIDGVTNLKSRLNVTDGSPTFLSGDLTVNETTTLQDQLTVNASSRLKGQVTISADVNGDKKSFDSYPLRIEGSNQGLAVKIDGSRSSNSHFVTFWDDENMQGRIEGQTTGELLTDPEYIFDNVLFANEIIRSTVDVGKAVAGVAAASSSSTVCVGLGACVTSPVPSLIVAAVAEVIMETANLALGIAQPIVYNVYKHANIGVTYQSGAADYAEWLPRSDINETFYPGDIVGVKGGYVTRSTENADHLMVISSRPIVLGNMPEEGKEAGYEKVAFMGQVPVKVLGKVKAGDYIVPGGYNNGAGIAVSPEDIRPDQYQEIVGIAWSGSESQQYSYVNVAVGLNAHDIAKLSIRQEQKIREQESEIKSLRDQLSRMDAVLDQLLPDYHSFMQDGQLKGDKLARSIDQSRYDTEGERTVVYHEITREQILDGINLAERTLMEEGVDLSNNPFFTKLRTEPGYKEQFIDDILASVKEELEAYYENDLKSGANVIRLY